MMNDFNQSEELAVFTLVSDGRLVITAGNDTAVVPNTVFLNHRDTLRLADFLKYIELTSFPI